MNQNPPQMLRSPNSGQNQYAVQLPNNPMGQGQQYNPNGTQPNPMQMQNVDPMAQLRGMMNGQFANGTMGNMSGGIQWEKYTQNASNNQVLADCNTGPDENSIQWQLQQLVPFLQLYMQGLVLGNRNKFYELYLQCVEGFIISDVTRQPCPVREAFVRQFQRNREFGKVIGLNSMPLFGYTLFCRAQELGGANFNWQHCGNALEISVRGILFFEMINWMNKTQEGQVHARNLPRDLQGKIPNLNKNIEVMEQACQLMGANNNYANLKFEIKTIARDMQNLRYDKLSETIGATRWDNQPLYNPDDYGEQEMMRQIQETRERNRRAYGGHSYQQADVPEESLGWERARTDFARISSENKDQYDVRKFFRNIGKENHYFIPETDWKKIKHVFTKHSEMGLEQTVLPGCFRIVIIDLDRDDGWFSTIVRKEGVEVATILTNPRILLPELENVDGSGIMRVKTMDLEEVVVKDSKLEIDLEPFKALENVLPIIQVPDVVEAGSTKELETTMLTLANRLTSQLKDCTGVSIKAIVKDGFSCVNPEDKETLVKDFPFLFKDVENSSPASYFKMLGYLLKRFSNGVVHRELCDFIDERLTSAFNTYLVTRAGYSSSDTDDEYFHTDSVIRDRDELAEIFKDSDEHMHELFHSTKGGSALIESMKIFTEGFTDEANLSIIDQLKEEQELKLDRTFHVTYLSKLVGPDWEADQTVVLKRSTHPEYFEAIEQGFKKSIPDTDINSVDKLLCFLGRDDHVWLFNYSGIDNNTATLRHLDRSYPFVLLETN